uniref:Uncharacterized protein n=1 Tax=Solanum lycopersicum TaxID=4081 RepID=A0A3Q7GZU9_SOLLC
MTPVRPISLISNEVAPAYVDRPIANALYDPSFSLVGLPVDPILR